MSEVSETAQVAADAAAAVVAEFAFFDDWEDRYRYLIDLGRRVPPLDDAYKIEENRLRGCQSVVHFVAESNDGRLAFLAQSDAPIVQGLIAILLRVYSGKTLQDIIATPPDFLEAIGFDKYLSPTRKNGLGAMVAKIKASAEEALSA